MTLAEAIRLGAMSIEQCSGRMFDKDELPTRACVIGTALYAASAVDTCDAGNYSAAKKLWPELWGDVTHPVHRYYDMMMWVLIDLNDFEHWTREQIADWVETLEGVPTVERAEVCP